jgi:hypothetical protein
VEDENGPIRADLIATHAPQQAAPDRGRGRSW